MPEQVQTMIQLMIAAKQGDTQAFSDIYQEYYLPIYRYLFKRCKHQALAEDLSQAVFLRLYKSKTEYRDTGKSPLQYLYIVARSVLADYWRKNANRKQIALEELNNSKQFSRTNTVSQKIDAEQALSLLKGVDKQVLELKLLQGYPTREIAKKLQKTEAAVRQIQCRALKKIRKMIKQYES